MVEMNRRDFIKGLLATFLLPKRTIFDMAANTWREHQHGPTVPVTLKSGWTVSATDRSTCPVCRQMFTMTHTHVSPSGLMTFMLLKGQNEQISPTAQIIKIPHVDVLHGMPCPPMGSGYLPRPVDPPRMPPRFADVVAQSRLK